MSPYLPLDMKEKEYFKGDKQKKHFSPTLFTEFLCFDGFLRHISLSLRHAIYVRKWRKIVFSHHRYFWRNFCVGTSFGKYVLKRDPFWRFSDEKCQFGGNFSPKWAELEGGELLRQTS